MKTTQHPESKPSANAYLPKLIPFEREDKTKIPYVEQAQQILDQMLELQQYGYEEIGITYSANEGQAAALLESEGRNLNLIKGNGQAAVVREMANLINSETNKKYHSLNGVVRLISFSTMSGPVPPEDKLYVKIDSDSTEKDINNLNGFLAQKDKRVCLIGWENQNTTKNIFGPTAIGGGESKNVRKEDRISDSNLQKIRTATVEAANAYPPPADLKKQFLPAIPLEHHQFALRQIEQIESCKAFMLAGVISSDLSKAITGCLDSIRSDAYARLNPEKVKSTTSGKETKRSTQAATLGTDAKETKRSTQAATSGTDVKQEVTPSSGRDLKDTKDTKEEKEAKETKQELPDITSANLRAEFLNLLILFKLASVAIHTHIRGNTAAEKETRSLLNLKTTRLIDILNKKASLESKTQLLHLEMTVLFNNIQKNTGLTQSSGTEEKKAASAISPYNEVLKAFKTPEDFLFAEVRSAKHNLVEDIDKFRSIFSDKEVKKSESKTSGNEVKTSESKMSDSETKKSESKTSGTEVKKSESTPESTKTKLNLTQWLIANCNRLKENFFNHFKKAGKLKVKQYKQQYQRLEDKFAELTNLSTLLSSLTSLKPFQPLRSKTDAAIKLFDQQQEKEAARKERVERGPGFSRH